MAYIISGIDDFSMGDLWQFGNSICDICGYAVCFRNSGNGDVSFKNAWYDRDGERNVNIHEGDIICEGLLYRNITYFTFVGPDDDCKSIR